MMLFWIAQGIGLIALLFLVLSFISRNRSDILSHQITGSVIYMLHFAFLSAWTGVAMNGIVALRNWVFGKNGTHAWAKHQGWMWAFMALSIGALLFVWEGYISLLPATAMVVGTYARWQHEEWRLRLLALLGVVLWIPYTVAVYSYAGTLTQIVMGIAGVYGILRHDTPRFF